MNTTELIDALREILEAEFLAEGFVFRKSRCEYHINAGEIRPIFRINIMAKYSPDYFLITPEVYVCCPAVNKLYTQLSPKRCKRANTASTTGFGIGNATNHERGRYTVESLEDITPVAESIWKDYQDVARPFYQQVSTVAKLDTHMNSESNGHTVSSACTALCAARLAGNPNLMELSAKYKELVANYPDSDRLAAFIAEFQGSDLQSQQETDPGKPDT